MSEPLIGSSVSISMISLKPLREGFNVAVAGRGPCNVRLEGTWVNNLDIASRQLIGGRKFPEHSLPIVAPEEARNAWRGRRGATLSLRLGPPGDAAVRLGAATSDIG